MMMIRYQISERDVSYQFTNQGMDSWRNEKRHPESSSHNHFSPTALLQQPGPASPSHPVDPVPMVRRWQRRRPVLGEVSSTHPLPWIDSLSIPLPPALQAHKCSSCRLSSAVASIHLVLARIQAPGAACLLVSAEIPHRSVAWWVNSESITPSLPGLSSYGSEGVQREQKTLLQPLVCVQNEVVRVGSLGT